MPTDLSNLTPAVAVALIFLTAMVIMLREVFKRLADKDLKFTDHINTKDKEFTRIISNHLHDVQKVMGANTSALNLNTKTNEKILELADKNLTLTKKLCKRIK